MPLHTTAKQKWEVFLRTLIKHNSSHQINVTNADDNEVHFIANEETIKYFRNLLNNPETLKQKVIHAICLNKQNENSNNLTIISTHDNIDIPQYFNILPVDLLYSLLEPQFLENGIGLINNSALQNFQFDELNLTAKLHIEGTQSLIKRDVAKYEMLINSLPEASKALQILQKNEPPINAELLEPTNLSSVITIQVNQPPTSVDIIYNYGRLLQMLQLEDGLSNNPPVIALPHANNHVEWVLNKEILVKYLTPIFSNIIFTQDIESNDLRPIMFSPKKAIEQPHSLHALFDISGSMQPVFKKYINEYLNILNKFIISVSDWEIHVVQFNTYIQSKVFNSQEHTFYDIKHHIEQFKAGGRTNLHEALYKGLEYYKNLVNKDLFETLLIFTDGVNNEGIISVQQIIDIANITGQNSNFSLFSMGMGAEYNKQFFSDIANKGGFIHFDLNTTNDISLLNSYMESCSNTRILLEFIDDTIKLVDRIPADGDIHVSNNVIAKETLVHFNGITHTIGSEELGKLPDLVSTTHNTEHASTNINEEILQQQEIVLSGQHTLEYVE